MWKREAPNHNDGTMRPMLQAMSLYLDDSGSRQPDRNPSDPLPKHGCDWFGLGGILIRDADADVVRARHRALVDKWSITTPLHSWKIRGRREEFKWLGDHEKRAEFLEDLTALLTSPEITATACVVDRPGYNARYREAYGRQRWLLCKTAFSIVVERAAKYARRHACKLRVCIERSDKKTDTRLEGYYDAMRSGGHPFDRNNAAKYGPLSPEDLRDTLYEFRLKDKKSPLMQMADLCLFPICMGGYAPDHPSFRALREAKTLLDCRIPEQEVASGGIKYSCWELVPRA